MELKDYKMQPDEGLYEKIERRVMRRRMLRVGGVAAAVVLVAAGVWVALSLPSDNPSVALKVGEPSANELTSSVETQPAASPRATIQKTPEVIETRQIRETGIGETQQVASLQRNVDGVENQQAAVQQETYDRPQVAVEMKPVTEKKETVPSTAMETSVAPESEGSATIVEEPQPTATEKAKAGGGTGTADEHGTLMWAPNAIAPDAETEVNRVFKLKFNAAVTDFHIYIYNRGGRQLYTSMDPDFEWDATYQGRQMPQGAYVWVAKFRDSNGKLYQERGTVTVIR